MGLHVIALAKLGVVSSSRALSPLGASLLWCFVLKLSCSLSLVRRSHTRVLYASRLFFFQMGRIVLGEQEPAAGAGTRLQRAMRLVWQRVVHVRRSPTQRLSDEESFHALSMLAL